MFFKTVKKKGENKPMSTVNSSSAGKHGNLISRLQCVYTDRGFQSPNTAIMLEVTWCNYTTRIQKRRLLMCGGGGTNSNPITAAAQVIIK